MRSPSIVENRAKANDGEVATATGQYLTVWGKGDGGRWEILADSNLTARDPVPLRRLESP